MSSYNFSDLKEKVVIVVGGFGLIGRAISEGFIRVQSKTIIADKIKDKKFLQKLQAINKKNIIYIAFDVTNDKDTDKLITDCLKKFSRIDVLVNCSWPRTKDWAENVERVLYSSVKKNLTDQLGGFYNLTRQVALQMKKQKRGCIINLGSIYGIVAPTFSIYEGTKMTSPSAYALIKGGVVMMTKYFASYFGKYNVRVNCISPGGVYHNEDEKFVKNYSKLTPLGRMANPDDIVMPILFLASDGSRYITGHDLLVDGGWTIH